MQLPPYTDTGANTFGCLVNGAVWTNVGASYVTNELGIGMVDTNKVQSGIFFDALNRDSLFTISAGLTLSKKGVILRDEYMNLDIPKKGNLEGVYKLTLRDGQFSYNSIKIDYVSLVNNPITVTIKKDTMEGSKHIVSGTFNGMLYAFSGPFNGPSNNILLDSVRITGGVFDALVK